MSECDLQGGIVEEMAGQRVRWMETQPQQLQQRRSTPKLQQSLCSRGIGVIGAAVVADSIDYCAEVI